MLSATGIGIVSVTVVLVVRDVAEVFVVSVIGDGLVNDTGEELICVAGADIVTVNGVAEDELIVEIVVFAGTPGPVMG
jgi:hypothetical protein